MSEDNVLVWCLDLSRTHSLPRCEHKGSRPSSVPPPDGPSLLRPRCPQPHSPSLRPPPSLPGVANSQGWWHGHCGWPATCLDSETFSPGSCWLKTSVTLTTEPCRPHLSLPPSLLTCWQPWVAEVLGVPHPGHPSSTCPDSPHNTFLSLSLTTFFSRRPHWPLVQPLLPQGQPRTVSRASRGSIPLQGSLFPRP